MTLFIKSITSSRTRVNDEKSCQQDFKEFYYKAADQNNDYQLGVKNGGIIDTNNNKNKGLESWSSGNRTSLTVWRKSLLMSCSGFTVIDSKGNLVYRVDNYRGRPGEIVLMDASGTSVLTIRRQKTLRLVDDWLVYKGDASTKNSKTTKKKQPICYVKKNVSLLQGHSNVLAHVYLGTNTKNPTYVIEGSYGQRSCKVLDKSSNKIVAEIKRKEAANGCASFGVEVFQLIVYPGFDSGFAMTMVLLLDQMFS